MNAGAGSRSKGSRLTLSRLPFAAIIIVTMAAVIAIASIWDSSRPEKATEANAPATVPDPCVETREACATVQSNGRDWRYSLLRASTPTKRTAILDLGGPGVAPLSGTFQLATYASQLPEAGKYNLLVIEEPWVTATVNESCRAAATNYYRSVRSDAKDLVQSARSLHDACQLGRGRWGFDPLDYSRVVTAIAGKESLDLVGFIGHSFGLARYNYLSGDPGGETVEWAVLARPFPVGMDATSFARQRALLIRKRFGAPPSVFRQTVAPSRSLPVTKFDELSAIVGLGYAPEGGESEALKAVTRDKDPATVGRYSDNLWHRYGTDSISPAYLAQLDETCRATTASDKLPDALSLDPLAELIVKLLLPCAGDVAQKLSLRPVPTCVTVSKGDTVVAGDASLSFIRRSVKNAAVFESSKPSHQSQDGLSYCLREASKSA